MATGAAARHAARSKRYLPRAEPGRHLCQNGEPIAHRDGTPKPRSADQAFRAPRPSIGTPLAKASRCDLSLLGIGASRKDASGRVTGRGMTGRGVAFVRFLTDGTAGAVQDRHRYRATGCLFQDRKCRHACARLDMLKNTWRSGCHDGPQAILIG